MLDDKDTFANQLSWIALACIVAERRPQDSPKSLVHLGDWLKRWSPHIDKELVDDGFLPKEAL